MKPILKYWAGLLAIALPIIPAIAAFANPTPPVPTARVLPGGTQIELKFPGRTTTVDVSDLNAQVIDAVNCRTGRIEPRQTLSGMRVFGNRRLSVDPTTGNVAVGVVLQECLGTQTSAVFVIQPQNNGAAYAIYRAQVPGSRALPDEFSTYPLGAIQRVRYLDGDLLVRNGSIAVESQALLVFTPSNTPAGEYAGCVVTRQGEGRSLCPQTR
ncbi:MAG: hypothetical protein MUF49_03485 [Oculatellaceae cyanobacterium Prado106]|jgi:hypothetical protein|nr:hypothetical protein [Oculatellaceae cyanobacterium Prado106]